MLFENSRLSQREPRSSPQPESVNEPSKARSLTEPCFRSADVSKRNLLFTKPLNLEYFV